MKKNILVTLTFLLICIQISAQTANWTNLGPIPFPKKTIGQVHGIGRVSEIKFHPTNSDIMYCASASGGLWISNNKGVNWVSLGTDNIANVQSASLAIDPTNDQIIYWGTGDANYYSSGQGVYKTTNRGVTWSLSNTGMGNRLVIEILVFPNNSQNIVAATNSGIYKSTNGGSNWVLKSASGIQFTDMIFKPGTNGQIIYAAAKKGFYRSLDAGETWAQVSSSAFVFAADGCRLAVSSSSPNIVYLGNVGANTVCEMYRSSDGGNSWVNARSESTQALAGYDASGGGQGNYNFDIEVNPTNANEVYVCAHVIWRSTNAGSTWTKQQNSWAFDLHTDQHHILFDPYVNGQLWNANDGGVWSNKTNGTGAWTPMSDGIAATEIYRAASSNINKSLAYIGTQDNGGLYYSLGIWYNDRGGDWGPEEFFDYSTNYVYCDELGTRKMYPTGGTQNLNFPFTASNSARTKFAFCPANTTVAYVANSGKIYRSSNINTNTPSWVLIFTMPSGSVRDLETDPSDANELYIISNDQKVYRSTNAASANPTFTTINLPSSTNNAGWIAPINGTNVVYASANNKIYRSGDNAATWNDVTSGFPNANINGLVADRFGAGIEGIYASYANGVYYRDNTKTSWSNYSQGLPIVCDITDLFYYNDATKQGLLRVSFYGRGMWETPMVGTNNNVSVSLTSPTNGSTFTTPATINLAATATASTGSISKVEFYQGNSLLHTDNTTPYTFTWTNVNFGSYILKAVAYDNTGNSKSSSNIAVTVNLVCNKLNGTPFGTTPAYAVGSEFNKAFDGNINTFVDVAAANGGFTGLDLGSTKILNAIRFYPRDGQEGRMDGGIFQASNSANFSSGVVTLHTISGSPSNNWNEVVVSNSTPYRYVRYLSPNNGYCNIAEIEFCGAASNQNPIISITSPANNIVVNEGSSQVFTANASDVDGTINKVEFYSGTTLLGQSNSAPYTYTWSNLVTGNYVITAVAYDNQGAKTTSSPINLRVNKLPSVVITAPSNNFIVNEGINLTLTANANDTDGTVSKIEFFQGNVLIGTSISSPYNFIWNNLVAGTYVLTAKATDNNGGVTTSPAISLRVNKLPTITIISPVNNTIVNEGSSLTISTSATDLDGTISKVEFFNGTTLLGQSTTSPFNFTSSSLLSGNYSIIARATDNNGGIANSAIISVIINKLPTISISTPVNNSIIQEFSSIKIGVNAADQDGSISKVEYYNGSSKLGESNIAPFEFNINSAVAGNYSFLAKAFDNNGGVSTSAVVNVIVNKAPTINITSPVNNGVVPGGGSLTITVNAIDSDGTISKVEFYNGTSLIGQSVTAPFLLTISPIIVGNYSFTAKAFDNRGGVATSAIVKIKANSNPTVRITNPSNGAIVNEGINLVLTTAAADIDGTIAKVEFFNGSTLLGQSTSTPFSFTINNIQAGNFQLTAKATDNDGATVVSTLVNFIVNKLPQVSITSPTNNANVVEGVNLAINVNASDQDGNISKVEYYNGASLLGQSTIQPYSFVINNIVAGSYTITARATDNRGAVTTSTAINIKVNTPINQSPSVNIISPLNNSIITAGNSFSIIANANDPDGNITKVEFYNGATLLGQSISPPFTFSLTSAVKGTYFLTAKAFDNKNGIATSDLVTVIVKSIPKITISSPSNNSVIKSNTKFNISVSAIDPDNAISKIEYYVGTNKVGEIISQPYIFTANGLSSGNYVLLAKALDISGVVVAQSSVQIIVNSDPTVTITAPFNNTVANEGEALLIEAAAADTDGSITEVGFYFDNQLLGVDNTFPYQWNINSLVKGTYSITAKAKDNNGAIVTSSNINLLVKSKVEMTIVSPENNSILTTGSSVGINIAVVDPDMAVSKLFFYLNNVKIGEVTSSPYYFNYINVASGSQIINVVAVDINGKSIAKKDLTLIGNQFPTVSITNPTNNSIYNELNSIPLIVNAEDKDGNISKVEFYIDGVKVGERNSLPHNFNVNSLPKGIHQITAKAYDNLGWVSTSSIVQITINALPNVVITSPQDKKVSFLGDSVEIQINATDLDGTIAKVLIYDGGTMLGEILTSPYTMKISGLALGSHTITAQAIDDRGGKSSSSGIEIIVEDRKTSIAGNTMIQSLEVYPNPNNGQFQFNLSQYQGKTITYRVIDMAGSEIIALTNLGQNLSAQLTQNIVLPNSASGNYLLQITADAEVITKKLVVVRLPKVK